MKAAIDLLHMTDVSDLAADVSEIAVASNAAEVSDTIGLPDSTARQGRYKNVRKAAILGDMFELGTDEAALHREVGIYAAGKDIDVIICVGRLCRNMYDGVRSVGNPSVSPYYYESKEALFADIGEIIRDGDIVLVKASHGMHFEEIIERLS